jgi:hypothetical protein
VAKRIAKYMGGKLSGIQRRMNPNHRINRPVDAGSLLFGKKFQVYAQRKLYHHKEKEGKEGKEGKEKKREERKEE